ncbi:MAG: dihydrodipicolinate synthase family protein [Chloroflexi bacterium]|nr:dihydrodipicolinate synthase family protein [Chloroflexota bacterium]MBT6681046.1 dihydrodipicolinate synthase family protein [Chloroflexota bacterium]
MVDRNMRGIFPILAVPFDPQGNIVIEDLQHEVDWIAGHGIPGVGIALASEVYKLSDSERGLVLKTVVEAAKGRLKVVMNTGHEGTGVAIDYAKAAQDQGASALMIKPPSFNQLSAAETTSYYVAIAEAVEIPIFMQDVGGAPVPPALAIQLARAHENLCYIKVEVAPCVPRIAELVARSGASGLIPFGGAGGGFLLEEARRGSQGSMPWSVIPDVYARVWDDFQAGNEADAEAEYRRYAALNRTIAQGMGAAMWINDRILFRRGIFQETSQPRQPASRIDEQAMKELDAILEELDLIGK